MLSVRLLIACATILLSATGPGFADIRNEIATNLQGEAIVAHGSAIDLQRLRLAYEVGGFEPIWVEPGRPAKKAFALLVLIGQSRSEGLEPGDYSSSIPQPIGNFTSDRDLALLDLILSDAFLDLARDVHGGRTTPAISEPDIVIPRKPVEAQLWLEAARTQGPEAVILALTPTHRQYAQLRSMLAGYRALADRGGWPLVSEGETLKPGMQDFRVGELRANLSKRGYDGIDPVSDPSTYDVDLEAVVKHFQRRHGLEVDGAVGPATISALNVTAEQRVRQIIVNLERWRWLPDNLGERYVLVNQAFFFLELFEAGSVTDRRRVIVGKPYHKTPMFSDQIKYADFNPTWTVPQSISRNEYLPKLKSDPGYLSRNNMVLYSDGTPVDPYSVNWSAISGRFPYRIVQQPGERNALGRVKFMFPNEFSVYLHDTPSRNLFGRTGRAFSHGCIRVDDPLDFAQRLFMPDQGLTRAEIDGIIATRKLTRRKLNDPVDVHLTYFTAWIDDNGVPAFFSDIYARDAIVERVLFGAV